MLKKISIGVVTLIVVAIGFVNYKNSSYIEDQLRTTIEDKKIGYKTLACDGLLVTTCVVSDIKLLDDTTIDKITFTEIDFNNNTFNSYVELDNVTINSFDKDERGMMLKRFFQVLNIKGNIVVNLENKQISQIEFINTEIFTEDLKSKISMTIDDVTTDIIVKNLQMELSTNEYEKIFYKMYLEVGEQEGFRKVNKDLFKLKSSDVMVYSEFKTIFNEKGKSKVLQLFQDQYNNTSSSEKQLWKSAISIMNGKTNGISLQMNNKKQLPLKELRFHKTDIQIKEI